MKLLTGILCAVLFAVLGTVDSQAQYTITNNSPVPVTVCIHTANCGIFGPFNVPPGAVFVAPVPIPPCQVTGLQYPCPGGPIYPVGFAGFLPPPNPPTRLSVGPTGATFW